MSYPQTYRFSALAASPVVATTSRIRRPAALGPQTLGTALALLMSTAAAPPAHAVDGCLVLLCLAAPSWRAVPQCVPPIRQLLRDLARGRAFPSCAMAGVGNGSDHQWAYAPDLCPPQYTVETEGPNGPIYHCLYSGAITVSVKGSPWSRTWWDLGGGSVTEFSAAAKQQVGSWDRQFEDDYARWLAAQPPPAICTDC